MSAAVERQFLGAVLRHLDSPRGYWTWRIVLLESTAVASVALVAYWVAKPLGSPNPMLVLMLTLTFVGGFVLGALALWQGLRTRALLLKRFLDSEGIRARLRELED